jgi:hypothetical protein
LTTSEGSSTVDEYYRREILLRRSIFQAMVRTVRLLTVCLIVIVAIKSFV